ncbi:hypothetical protein [uncultured Tateyamaria sp.]|uniref:hypothetical protein n=1 Tax=uncultured Tateyamaria sp. TaxID=455651 RepID=UPI0026155456|nr:hypothetical protein [uncultured Tateyamaria sp.]
MTPYAYETSGRNRKTLVAVLLVWAAILAAVLFLDASLWIAGLIGLCTAPALYDLIAGRRSGVALGPDGLSWFAGRRTGQIAWNQISHMRLDTRLDFSVRSSAVLVTGRKVRLPLECTPESETFEKELSERGIKVERHHFSLLG